MSNVFKWQSDMPANREIKQISFTKLRDFGLSKNAGTHVNDLEELELRPPNIVLATATKTLKFIQNYFKEQELVKGTTYVMGLGVFQQLCTTGALKQKFLKPSQVKFKNVYRPYKGQNLDGKSILIFRTGGIGDLLFIQPNLIHLKKKYPTCIIKFACGPQYQSMVNNWDCVDEVLDLPFVISHLMNSDYHALFEGVIERCKEGERTNALRLFTRWLGLNLPDEELVPQQKPKLDKVEFCLEKLKEWNVEPNNFILTQLRASSPIRTPDPKFWIEMINKLTDRGHNVIITDNPRQTDFVDQFINNLKNKDKVFNFCKHSKSLDYSIALISLSKLTIATDSAMVHISASLDKHCYGIYGPFPGSIRLETYPKARWVDATYRCTPCYIHSQNPCPNASTDGFSPCYNNIDIDKVIIEAEELMNE